MSTQARTASELPSELPGQDGAMIAYRHSPGKSPGVMFLTGFKSDMQGGKALALEDYCLATGRAFTRFDYFGHGESSGRFEDGTIGRWADDAVRVLDAATSGPLILVGSSMGGWIMLLAALRRKERIAGLLGIAAAPDFTEDLIPPALSEAQKQDIAEKGHCEIPNCYDDQEPYVIRAELLDEGRNHLLLRGDIDIEVPVRLIHGMRDADVPWQTALRLSEKLRSDDVEIQWVKDGEHRLSRPSDLARLVRTLDVLIATVG